MNAESISVEKPSSIVSLPLSGPPSGPPESWALARHVALRVTRPLGEFLKVEAASGVVLMMAAAVALAWANSPWAESYHHLWHTSIGLSLGGLRFEKPLHFWINDALMVLFFFVAGLEIRREIHEGELSDARRAALPAVAALGGMIAPALIYAAVNHGTDGAKGWGVPMATDIAFAVGVLALLGKRVPAALRVLLLALAIIDDIGAIVVIAVFLTSDFHASGLVIAAAGVGAIVAMQRFGVRRALAYVPAAFIVWVGMLRAGVHPTVAGVVVGLVTPVRSWYGRRGFLVVARRAVNDLGDRSKWQDDHAVGARLRELEHARREALPPVVRLSTALHPWVAFGIMPLFALANAGVDLRSIDMSGAGAALIAFGVAIGLLLGKPIGVFLASFLSVKLGLCALPRGVDWRGIALVGLVAGIGFTMAIFIAGLALPAPERLGVAKLAVLLGSGAAGIAGMLGGRFLLPKQQPADVAAVSVDDAEASTQY